MAKFNVKEPMTSPYKPVVSWRVWFDGSSDKFGVCLWVKDVNECFCYENLSADAAHFIIYLLGLDGRRWADPSSKKLQVEGGVGKWT